MGVLKKAGRDETALDWGNYTAVDPSIFSNGLDSFVSQVREASPTFVFTLLMVSNLCLMVQYLSIQLYISLIPGNKFTNGIAFGLAEIFGTGLSQVLVSRFNDVTAFYITVAMGEIGYLTFILFPQDGLHTYVATFMVMACITAWLNLSFLMIELRVPPAKVSITGVIVRTASMLVGVVAPTTAAIPHTYRFILMAACGAAGALCTACLPPPGLYLPASKKTGKNKVQLIDRQTEQTYLDPVIKPLRDTNYGVCSTSFKETYTERRLQVQRVRLNETRLDPDLYIQLSRMYSRMERHQNSEKRVYEKLDKAWGLDGSSVEDDP